MYALAVFQGQLFVGGFLSSFAGIRNSIAAKGIAAWNGSAWSTVGSGSSTSVNNQVFALAVYGDQLIAGGDFTAVSGSNAAANRIAAWNGTSWTTLVSGSRDGFSNGEMRALAVFGDKLVGGGSFASFSDGTSANRLAVWDRSSWSAVPAGAGSGINNGVVHSLTVFQDKLYTAGTFTTLGDGTPARYIAEYS